MLDIKRKIGPFCYRRIWFANEAPALLMSGFTSLRQFAGKKAPFLWARHEFHTILINLLLTEEDIIAGIKKNTNYEIRRAEKEGVVSTLISDITVFQKFFNNFAPTRSLKLLSIKNLESLSPFLTITAAVYDEKPIAMHAYLTDSNYSRARLLYSATIVRSQTHSTEEKNSNTEKEIDNALIGRANKYLHLQDMLLFKSKGIKTCDLGGIAGDPSKAETAGIDSFKLAFGGTHSREDHFDSPLLSAAQFLKGLLHGKEK